MKPITKVYPKVPSPCACMNLRRASRAVTQFYDDILQPSGITVAQLSLLKQVKLSETPTISELAKQNRIDRTTLNRNLKPLVDAGLITVNPGKDPRTKLVRLTEPGDAALTQGWSLWGEAQEVIQDYLGEANLAILVNLLSKLEALAP